ncbi:MAG: hypothetical protein WCS30_05160 [Selenomonadaceae bacterium]
MLFSDFSTFDFLFEALCERDLRIYAEVNDGWRFIIVGRLMLRWNCQMASGGGFEIKLGVNQIDKAAASLLAMKKAMSENEPGTEGIYFYLPKGYKTN